MTNLKNNSHNNQDTEDGDYDDCIVSPRENDVCFGVEGMKHPGTKIWWKDVAEVRETIHSFSDFFVQHVRSRDQGRIYFIYQKGKQWVHATEKQIRDQMANRFRHESRKRKHQYQTAPSPPPPPPQETGSIENPVLLQAALSDMQRQQRLLLARISTLEAQVKEKEVRLYEHQEIEQNLRAKIRRLEPPSDWRDRPEPYSGWPTKTDMMAKDNASNTSHVSASDDDFDADDIFVPPPQLEYGRSDLILDPRPISPPTPITPPMQAVNASIINRIGGYQDSGEELPPSLPARAVSTYDNNNANNVVPKEYSFLGLEQQQEFSGRGLSDFGGSDGSLVRSSDWSEIANCLRDNSEPLQTLPFDLNDFNNPRRRSAAEDRLRSLPSAIAGQQQLPRSKPKDDKKTTEPKQRRGGRRGMDGDLRPPEMVGSSVGSMSSLGSSASSLPVDDNKKPNNNNAFSLKRKESLMNALQWIRTMDGADDQDGEEQLDALMVEIIRRKKSKAAWNKKQSEVRQNAPESIKETEQEDQLQEAFKVLSI